MQKPKKTEQQNSHDPLDYYTRAVNKYKLLSKEEEYAMACAIRDGDSSLEKDFINSNLRLVLKVAIHYKKRGLSFSDIIEEGNMGLMHAVKRFDPDRGFRFATYAVWWVRQAIERALMSQTRTIRLPVHVVKKLSRCVRLGEKAAQHANSNNISDVVMAEESDTAVDVVRTLMSYKHNTVSLENKSYSDSEHELIDFIASDDCPEENVSQLYLKKHIDKCMSGLSAVEMSVLSAKYGLQDKEELSLNEIASMFKLTRDQVRRVLYNALLKMRRTI